MVGISSIARLLGSSWAGGWNPLPPCRRPLAASSGQCAATTAAFAPSSGPELCYSGPVLLQPEDSFPLPGAVFTDGSLSVSGGAAAVPDTDASVLASVPSPRSSTHCELVALCLAAALAPPHILTDSLAPYPGLGCLPHQPCLGVCRPCGGPVVHPPGHHLGGCPTAGEGEGSRPTCHRPGAP